jgi:hypothetical protein
MLLLLLVLLQGHAHTPGRHLLLLVVLEGVDYM